MKIAHSYVRDAAIDTGHASTVRAILRFAHNIGVAVIAQGVETEEQNAVFKDTAAIGAQGFHFSRPVSAEKPAVLLRLGTVDRGVITSGSSTFAEGLYDFPTA